jgi:hypothetical protein
MMILDALARVLELLHTLAALLAVGSVVAAGVLTWALEIL